MEVQRWAAAAAALARGAGVDGVKLLFAEAAWWSCTTGGKRESSSALPALVVSRVRTGFSDPRKPFRTAEITPPLLSSGCAPSHGPGVLGRRQLPCFSLWLHPAVRVKPSHLPWLSTLLTAAAHSSSFMQCFPTQLFLTSASSPRPSLPFIPYPTWLCPLPRWVSPPRKVSLSGVAMIWVCPACHEVPSSEHVRPPCS